MPGQVCAQCPPGVAVSMLLFILHVKIFYSLLGTPAVPHGLEGTAPVVAGRLSARRLPVRQLWPLGAGPFSPCPGISV